MPGIAKKNSSSSGKMEEAKKLGLDEGRPFNGAENCSDSTKTLPVCSFHKHHHEGGLKKHLGKLGGNQESNNWQTVHCKAGGKLM